MFGELSLVMGVSLKWRGDLMGALRSFEDAAAAFRRIDHQTGIARALGNQSLVLRTAGHLARSRELIEEARTLQARIKNPRFQVALWVNLSVLEFAVGNFAASSATASAGLQIAERIALAQWQSRGLLARGRALAALRRLTESQSDLLRALDISREHGFAREEAMAHEFLGDLARSMGDWERARAEWEAALAIGERIAPRGDVTGEPLRRLAEAALAAGDVREALVFGRRAYDVNTSCGDRKERASTLRVLGDIARHRGRLTAARLAYEASVQELATMGAMGELAVSERALDALRAQEGRVPTTAECDDGADVAGDAADAAPGADFLTAAGPDAASTMRGAPARRRSVRALRASGASADADPASTIAFTVPSQGWEFVTRDAVLLHLVEQIRNVAPLGGTVLLLGETGTGKELLARFLHDASGRRGAFIATNASAFPDALLESELFGHARGSFTGAIVERKGLLEAAHGGTFFLDEIGDLPVTLQAKLLRTLEEGAVKRVGATDARKIDVRFVAATNRDLKEEIRSGRFRQDLYYRLAVHEFEIPPLRRRAGDIPLLARAFVTRSLAGRGKAFGGFDDAVENALVAHLWPGNVRELANEMQRAASRIGDGERVRLEHLSTRVRAAAARNAAAPGLFDDVAMMERSRIEDALAAAAGNQARAGEMLGMSRRALRYKILKYGLPVAKEQPERKPRGRRA
jgi:DNA-binding NtrC family response regulator/tetratricopeptide (TPR) repeat protein